MPTPSVGLYTQHLDKAGQMRSIITGIKVMMDNSTFRRNLIALHDIEVDLAATTPPADLVSRVEALSAALREFEVTLSVIEDKIRGSALYPE